MINIKAKSITHQHLLAIINTELSKIPEINTIRLLDAGCGDGLLIAYLHEGIRTLRPNINFEIYGFDVSDHGVQPSTFFCNAIKILSGKFPEINWNNRLFLLKMNDEWPFLPDFFDIIISNQVLEHIHDGLGFFRNIHKYLKQGGFSIHLFPLKNYIFEGHLYLPFVHRILNWDLQVAYIKLLSKIGLGKYPLARKHGYHLDDYSLSHADYMVFLTKYLSYNEVLKLGKQSDLRTSFRYTQEFYLAKYRSILCLKPFYLYSKNRNAFIDWFSIITLKYVSSITLFLQKENRYSR